jgi:putative transposase
LRKATNHDEAITEEQIIKILQEASNELSVEESCRKHGVSPATYYNSKSKFGGMSVLDASRLRALNAENNKLKRLVAEQALDIEAMKDVLSRKW